MNKQSISAMTWALALAFGMLAPLSLAANPHPQHHAAAKPSQRKAATKPVMTYSCPMHPEVKSTRKGKCPKCKMDLQPVRESASSAQENEMVSGTTGLAGAADVANAAATASAMPAENVLDASNKLMIPDVEVLDQEGNSIHFYSDLIKGKTVAINFIFTNCTTICPPLAATFARVQREMGDKVGKDVYFISVSVDPLTDTPERLKAWGAKFKAGPGWTFVTGGKQEIDKLLYSLAAYTALREDHSPNLIIGNDAKGVWTRTYGLAKPTQIVGLIERAIEGKLDQPQTKESTQP